MNVGVFQDSRFFVTEVVCQEIGSYAAFISLVPPFIAVALALITSEHIKGGLREETSFLEEPGNCSAIICCIWKHAGNPMIFAEKTTLL